MLRLFNEITAAMKSDPAVLHRITSLTKISRLKRNFHFVPDASLPGYDARFNISIDTLIESSRETLVKSTDIQLLAGNIHKLAEFRFAFNFAIAGLDQYISFITNDTFEIENELNLWLNNIVIATSRGIIFAELQGSPLDDLILPVTNPDLIP
jgi:hypothetical protein